MSDEVGEITVRTDHVIEWKINDFFSYTEEYKCYNSSDFFVSGSEWHLSICPNGEENNAVGWIGLYLYAKDCTESPKGAIFSLGVKKVDGSVEEKKECCWLFDDEGFGSSEFIERSDLLDRKTDLTPSETLTVTCYIKVVNENFDSLERLNSTCSNFLDLFTSKRACDVTLKVKDKEFLAHKLVLIAQSPVFAGKFGDNLKEDDTDSVNIQDCEPEAFEEFLCFLYSGKFPKFSNNTLKVYGIAKIYGAEELRKRCVLSILSNLSLKNVCEAAILGHNSGESAIKIKTQEFFNNNVREIVSTDEWISLMKNYNELASQMLKKMADLELM